LPRGRRTSITVHGARIFIAAFDIFLPIAKQHSTFEGLFQPMRLLVIFGIALLVFGPKKLPELGKGIGEGIRGFESATKEQEPAAITVNDHNNNK
jgi:sec-independent protein translocase protein TatA